MKFKFYATLLLASSLFGNAKAQNIPSPKQHFGFTIGDDYRLANFTQTEAYFKKLAASARTKYVDIGLTEEGRHQFMLIVSSPENIKQLDKYKRISQQLAHAENLTDAQARSLAAQGKSVVWIDGGLHATETVGIHQLIVTAYQLVTRNDAEVKHILDNTIILLVHANPDGQELVSNWYMREKDSTKRNMNVPRLWQKYIGHDNNRDFFMMNMKETQNITRQQYIEWLPQIVYNHHQTGPAGSVVAGPPYRDPYNYVYDPLLVTSIDAVGAAMNNRLNAENKPGYTQRSGTSFSTWWNGGLRTAPYFHNMVGLLTEIIGSPTPSSIPLVPERLIPNGATPNPVTPQPWHFRQSIDYSVSLNYAVLNYATNMRQDLLFNSYRMGKNSIERGSRDNWTLSPKKVDSINRAFKNDTSNRQAGGGFRNAGMPVKYYDKVLKDPTLRDARGYIIPADRTDFPTAVKFINALIRSGMVVQQATASFSVGGKTYPADSYVVKTDQAFRPHVLDMFEPQDHPNDFQYPGGPPVRPYDITGWTLAYQMGVKFDRVLEGFSGPFKRVVYGQLQTPPQLMLPERETVAKGYILQAGTNNSFIAINDLLKTGETVYRVPAGIANVNAGSFYVKNTPKAEAVLRSAAKNEGLKIEAADIAADKFTKVAPSRIALWDTYGGSMPSGWIRWLMEQYKFPFQLVYTQDIDAGNLKDKYDVIIFASGAIPAAGGRSGMGEGGGRTANLPAEFQHMVGRISAEKSVPQLKNFLEAGGHIVTIGSSANLAYQLNLPVQNALVETTAGGQTRPLSADKFYVPGSILQANIDTTQPANWGMNATADVDYDTSPVFGLKPGADAKAIIPLITFNSATPLRSGWAWGQNYLNHTIAAFEAPVGKGKLYVFGPEITFRGQAQGTFKLLFNQLYNLNNN
jgi:hypothetical protein